MSKKLRVLVIDDSAFNREVISEMLESHDSIEVVATGSDGEQGIKLAHEHRPDLITVDIEMPRMDGFTFLRIIMAQLPTPVIVISTHSRKHEVFQALELGALDFIPKPSRFMPEERSAMREDLVAKALAVRLLQIAPFRRAGTPSPKPIAAPVLGSGKHELYQVVCIGASTGGPPALHRLFQAQAGGGDTAFLVAQHMPKNFTRTFAERLNRSAALEVCEGEDGAILAPGVAYIAPGGKHMEVVRGDDNLPKLRISPEDPGDGYVPSVDRLFKSAAKVFGYNVLAAVLTGMGADGAVGVRAVHAAGGRALAESDSTAIVYGMPKEAAATGCVDAVLPLDEIIAQLQEFSAGGK